jgi:hypothetical protein
MHVYQDHCSSVGPRALPDKCGELGALRSGKLVADFTFHNPDPDQWLAVGVVCATAADAPLYTPHMLVGAGISRTAAVWDLQQRLDELANFVS